MKTVLLGALMALMSCSTIRVICVTSHASTVAVAESEEEICARICVKRPPAAPPRAPASPQVTCLITVDPTCALLSVTVYMLPAAPALTVSDRVMLLGAPAPALLTSFDRPLLVPPPKVLL